MNRLNQSRNHRGFSLIELLIVISIIAILAAMIIPAAGFMKQRRVRSVIKAELEAVATAIDSYKAKYGHYPPDNPCNVNVNPLYFELVGSRVVAGAGGKNRFETLDGAVFIDEAEFGPVFGAGACVQGFINTSRGANSDENTAATGFLTKLKPNQYGQVRSDSQARILVSSQPWSDTLTPGFNPVPSAPGLNPIRYNLTSPTNNPKSYDLWVDVVVGGRINRISNWSESHQFVANSPYP